MRERRREKQIERERARERARQKEREKEKAGARKRETFCVCLSVSLSSLCILPDPMNHAKIFKGRPRRDAFFTVTPPIQIISTRPAWSGGNQKPNWVE